MSVFAWLKPDGEKLLAVAAANGELVPQREVRTDKENGRPYVEFYYYDPTDPSRPAPVFPDGAVECYTFKGRIDGHGSFVDQGVYKLGTSTARVIWGQEVVAVNKPGSIEEESIIDRFQKIGACAESLEALAAIISEVRQHTLAPVQNWVAPAFAEHKPVSSVKPPKPEAVPAPAS